LLQLPEHWEICFFIGCLFNIRWSFRAAFGFGRNFSVACRDALSLFRLLAIILGSISDVVLCGGSVLALAIEAETASV
jgi:hypothetical protein